VFVELSPAELALSYFYTRTYGTHFAARIGSMLLVAAVATYFHIISIAIALIWLLAYGCCELNIKKWWRGVSVTLGTLSDAAAFRRHNEMIFCCFLTTTTAAAPFLYNPDPDTTAAGVSVLFSAGIIMIISAQHSMTDKMFLWTAPVPALALTINMMKLAEGVNSWVMAALAVCFVVNARQLQAANTAAEAAMVKAQVDADRAHKAKSTFHDAVTHVDQPIAVFNAEDRAVAFNQAFADLHRTPSDDAPVRNGITFRELADRQLQIGLYAAGDDEASIGLAMLLDHYQSGDERTYRLRDGRWMMVVYRRLPGAGRVALWTDITALKHAEAERRKLEAQLHHSQRLDALGTLAGGAAHEINNALVPVIVFTKLVAGRLPKDSRDRQNLAMALAGAERSRDMVQQILGFSRREERRRESIDLAAVLRDALRMMRATVPTSIRLEEEIAAVAPLTGDPNQLHQVVVNLVTNAAQAIGEAHGTITVGLRPAVDGGTLRLWVADTGCGMDEATRARVFEPFFTTKGVGKGTGLGLSVAHGIIQDHGGHIEVESRPGQGTQFTVVLPLQPAEATRPQSDEAQPSTDRGTRERSLVVRKEAWSNDRLQRDPRRASLGL
jgi:signal transduction histidine kinase